MRRILLTLFILNNLTLFSQINYPINQTEHWFLIGYLDSIETNKEIYKYSVNNISTSFAQIILREETEIVEFNGYYETADYKLIEKNNRSLFFGYEGKKMFEIQFDILKNDTILYLNFLTKDQRYLYKKQDYHFRVNTKTVKSHLTKKLFAGNYSLNEKSIRLSENGHIAGLYPFTNFDIIVNPYDEHADYDQIILIDTEKHHTRYGWKFEENFLVLYQLLKNEDYESGFYNYILDKEYLRLEMK